MVNQLVHRRSHFRGETPWYLSGGIASGNCLAAYQPKGAADLADSYINLVNPGTYDAAPGTAPTWDSTNGWKFDAGSSQYLTSGVAVPTGGAVICRFSTLTTSGNYYLFGSYQDATNRNSVRPDAGSGSAHAYIGGDQDYGGKAFTTGVACISGAKELYKDGASIGTHSEGGDPTTARSSGHVYIGALEAGSAAFYHASVYVQAFAMYSIDLSGDQIAAVTTAMAAL